MEMNQHQHDVAASTSMQLESYYANQAMADLDDDDEQDMQDPLERKRTAHSIAEQKRRDAIKKGFEDLQTLLPTLRSGSNAGQKYSKAIILQRAVEYLQFLTEERRKMHDQLDQFRKEVMALEIMKTNYEQIARVHNQPQQDFSITEEEQFNVFKDMMDTQFESFDNMVNLSTFETLSGSIINWLETNWKPEILESALVNSIGTTNESNRLGFH